MAERAEAVQGCGHNHTLPSFDAALLICNGSLSLSIETVPCVGEWRRFSIGTLLSWMPTTPTRRSPVQTVPQTTVYSRMTSPLSGHCPKAWMLPRHCPHHTVLGRSKGEFGQGKTKKVLASHRGICTADPWQNERPTSKSTTQRTQSECGVGTGERHDQQCRNSGEGVL